VSGAGLPFSAPAIATIEGTGSTWIVGGEFVIGDSGETRLHIEGGGRVESGHGGGATRIEGGGAEYGKPPSAVVVSGEGSTWDILGDFDIRRGTLSIVDGGHVTSGTNGDTDMDGPGEVTISGDDSKWEIEGRYQMASRGPVITRIAQGGLLSVSGNIASRPGGVLLLDGGRVEAQEISSDVEIRGSGTIQSDVFSSRETIVGNSTGMLAIDGNFTQTPMASLMIELAGNGGAAGVDFDQLLVTDTATLSGLIDVSLLDAFQPMTGDSFEIVRYGSVQFGNAGGMPPELRLPTLNSGLAWRSDFGTQALTVSVQAVPEPTSALLAVVGLLAAWRWGNKRLSSG
jgi:T5SS/PEP-CTERM-associated repeat protein